MRLEADRARLAREVHTTTGVEGAFDGARDAAAWVADAMGGELTAEKCVGVAVLGHPRCQAAFWRLGMSSADLVQSELFRNPTLALSLRLPDGGGLANVEASIAQNLADLWQLPARRRVAARAHDRALLDAAREIAAVAGQARAAFAEGATAGRRVEIARENRRVALQLTELAVARQTAGAGSAIDVNLARREALDAELALRDAELAEIEARHKLAGALGVEAAPESLRLVEPGVEESLATLDVEALAGEAVAQRLDVRLAAAAIHEAEAALVHARAQVFRSLEVGVGFEREARRRRDDRNLLAEAASASADAGALALPSLAPRERVATDVIVGPTLSAELPVFDQNQAQIAKAGYALEAARRDHEAVRRGAIQDVRLAARRAQAAIERVRFHRDEALPLSESSLLLARDAYRAGRAPFAAVLESQRQLLAARAREADARRDAAVVQAALEAALGRPLAAPRRDSVRGQSESSGRPSNSGEPGEGH
ncbi:MAG: TolC family protein [Phycisphaerae bacterium]